MGLRKKKEQVVDSYSVYSKHSTESLTKTGGVYKKRTRGLNKYLLAKIAAATVYSVLLIFSVAAIATALSIGVKIESLKKRLPALTKTFEDDYMTAIDYIQAVRRNISRLETQSSQLIQVISYPVASATTPCIRLPPSSPSGYYTVMNSTGSLLRVYCDMTRKCGKVAGGWMRVIKLNMTDSSQQCPRGLRQRTDGNIVTCVRKSASAGCSSIVLPTLKLKYTRVCGRITAYQFGNLEAFTRTRTNSSRTIDDYYVDGVSLTHGKVRQHIWTFVAAKGFDQSSLCTCIDKFKVKPPPSYVGSSFFCDAANEQPGEQADSIFHTDRPLWNGVSCGDRDPNLCCDFNSPPWFYKQLRDSITDDIEMRVCRDEHQNNEDIAIQHVEMYIQ